jgi:CheY-like chemotaxis protein
MPAPAEEERYQDQWVLLVERDVQSLVAITATLESLGLKVQTAADEEEALETLSEEHGCSMLLLAACLEAQEACDTIKALRDKAPLTDLPIAVLGELNASQQERCREAGACCFLNKPIEPEALANLIHASLRPTADRATERNA